MNKKIFLTILFAGITNLFAQTVFVKNINVPVIQNGIPSTLAWAGGLNDVSFSEIDLNQDGVNDLFAFEKDNGYFGTRYHFSTYINNNIPGQVSYTYAPQYMSAFPELREYALLRDYNCDGKADIFTYCENCGAGMACYKNVSTTGNLQFQLEYPGVMTVYSFPTNLYTAKGNQPALLDVDNDGDMDVLTFPVSGNWIEYHKNFAIENYGRCDTLVYEYQQGCFGNMALNPNNNSAVFNAGCFTGGGGGGGQLKQPPLRHSGECLLAWDQDHDGDKDILNGDVLANNLLFVNNCGTPQSANFCDQDSFFPKYDIPVDLYTFNDPSLIDVDNNGFKDLLVSPCPHGGAENYNCVWLYHNYGNAAADSFLFQSETFMVDKMIDVGEGANVRFADINNDGLQDMMIGNYGYFNKGIGYYSGLAYFKNTGTATAPQFELQTIDYDNIFADSLTAVHPAFGDLDGDGDIDMILGNEAGTILYYQNIAPSGQPANFVLISNSWFGIDAGKFSAPTIYDVNKDGLPDIVIGNELGSLNYYQNSGTVTSPVFPSGTGQTNFGSVYVTHYPSIKGYAQPYFFENGIKTELFVSCEAGNIYYYTNINGNLGGTFTLIDSVYKNINEPCRLSFDLFDINNDGLEDMVTGNYAGGVSLFYQHPSIWLGENQLLENHQINISPVPATDYVTIKLNDTENYKNISVMIFDNTGRKIADQKIINQYTVIETNRWSSGLYIAKIMFDNGTSASKKFTVK